MPTISVPPPLPPILGSGAGGGTRAILSDSHGRGPTGTGKTEGGRMKVEVLAQAPAPLALQLAEHLAPVEEVLQQWSGDGGGPGYPAGDGCGAGGGGGLEGGVDGHEGGPGGAVDEQDTHSLKL